MSRVIAVLCLLALGSAGCAGSAPPTARTPKFAIQAAAGRQVVVTLRPVGAARRLQAPVASLTLDDIAYVTVQLFVSDPTPPLVLASLNVLNALCDGKCPDETPQALAEIGPISREQLGQPIVLGSLAPRSTYYLRALAYQVLAAFEVPELISTQDGTSETSFTVDSDGSASVVLPLKLVDVQFDGAATTSAPVITEGGYTDPDASVVETISTSTSAAFGGF